MVFPCQSEAKLGSTVPDGCALAAPAAGDAAGEATGEAAGDAAGVPTALVAGDAPSWAGAAGFDVPVACGADGAHPVTATPTATRIAALVHRLWMLLITSCSSVWRKPAL